MNDSKDQYDELLSSSPIDKKIHRLDTAMAILSNLLVWLMLILMLMYAFFEPIKVSGKSMLPTLHHDDTVAVDKLYHNFTGIKRGDIVVIDNSKKSSVEFIIKRAVAIEGDRFGFVREIENGQYVINFYLDTGSGFVKKSEEYIYEPMTRADLFTKYEILNSFGELENNCSTVTEKHFLALGDNRNNSTDSRQYGEFAVSSVVGVNMGLIKSNSFFDKLFSFLYSD